MACRRFISNYCVSTNLKAVRSLPTLASRCYSTDRDEITKPTHTGQSFEPDDYRNIRFTNATRYVNKNWGINLVNEIPPKECTERVVACDGGDPHLGHPKVYINLDKPGAHACGYCGLRYILKEVCAIGSFHTLCLDVVRGWKFNDRVT